RLVNLDHDFVGRDVLRRRAEAAAAGLIGRTGEGRRAARAGSPVFVEGAQVGEITSGILSPTLGYPIAMALVEHDLEEGQDAEVYVRGRTMPMSVVTLPFYRRARGRAKSRPTP